MEQDGWSELSDLLAVVPEDFENLVSAGYRPTLWRNNALESRVFPVGEGADLLRQVRMLHADGWEAVTWTCVDGAIIRSRYKTECGHWCVLMLIKDFFDDGHMKESK